MIKAIETKYKGYRFRSRLEARWAVFFDALRWDWEYEPEGYDLGNGMWYLPDFKIDGTFIEIKATEPNENEKKKARLLAEGLDCAVLFGVGMPDPKKNASGLDGYGSPCIDGPVDWIEDFISFSSYCRGKWGRAGLYMYADADEDDYRAAEAARSARFEHGETPSTSYVTYMTKKDVEFLESVEEETLSDEDIKYEKIEKELEQAFLEGKKICSEKNCNSQATNMGCIWELPSWKYYKIIREFNLEEANRLLSPMCLSHYNEEKYNYFHGE